MNVSFRAEVYVDAPTAMVAFDDTEYDATTLEPAPATAKFTFLASGKITKQENGAAVQAGSWTQENVSDFSDYELRASLLSGDTPGGAALGVWHNFDDINPSFIVTDSGGSPKSSELSVEIRQVSDTLNTDTSVFNLSSTAS
jgi:hypothetical protein